jgi:hypothetical protein
MTELRNLGAVHLLHPARRCWQSQHSLKLETIADHRAHIVARAQSEIATIERP